MIQDKIDPPSGSTAIQNGDPLEPQTCSEPDFHGISLPILLLGNDLRLRRFTKQAAVKFQLKESDVGSQICIFNPKVPVLNEYAAQVLQTGKMSEREIQCQDGHWY